MSGRLNFEYGFNTSSAQPIEKDTPMRVFFLGDFTGTKAISNNALTNKVVKIDIDNFDDVMSKLSPSVILPSGHQVTFNELEDFHPDALFENNIFKNIRRLKRELGNSATAESAADEIMLNYQLGSETMPQAINEEITVVDHGNNHGKKAEDETIEGNDDMFERLLGQKQSTTTGTEQVTSSAQSSGNLDRFLGDILSTHIIKDAKPEHTSLMVFIDSAIEELMKSILHSDEFQALESAWRSVRDVIFNEEYDEANQFFYLVNTNRNVLNTAVAGDTSFVSTLSQHIKNTDVECYDVLIGNYRFSAKDEDITTLNYLASVAETLKCQLVSSADDSLINAESGSLWQQFKQTPQASHVALSYPQVLLRIPYGKKHDEVDLFAFEEFTQTHQYNKLLWGNSAFACARLLIRQYHNQENGQVTLDISITELPAFVYAEGDEKKLQSCGEFLLSEQELINIHKQGIMVFASYRNKNCIRLFGDGIRAVNT